MLGGYQEEIRSWCCKSRYRIVDTVAMKRFIDNVIVQVVERHYIGYDGPVKAIAPEYVGTLSDKDSSDIFSESYPTSSTGNEIVPRLERLEKALSSAGSQPI